MPRKTRSRRYSLMALAVAVFVLIVLPPVLPTYVVILLSQSLIYAIVAMSLDVLIGYADLGSLGHAAFFAIGAFTTAILETRYHVGFATSLFCSIGMAAAASALIGLFALRAKGIYFLLITLAVAMSIWGLIYRWASLTGGDNGVSDVVRPNFGGLVDLQNHVHFHYFVVIFYVICLLLMILLVRSPFGRTLVGIRDSETRMKVLGYNVWLHKYYAFIIAGAFAGVGGTLYAYFNQFVGPNDADLGMCMEFVLMVCLGGQGNLIGANIGALLITFMRNMVSIYTKRYLMILGFVYLLTAKYAPEGIMGLLRRFGKGEEVA